MKSAPAPLHGGVVAACALLCVTGLVMVFSTTAPFALEAAFPPHFVRHALALALGLGVAAVGLRIPLGLWHALALPLWAVGVGLLVLTACLGVEINGARRWLEVPGWLRFQPGEFARWSTLVLAAALLARRRFDPREDTPSAFWMLLGGCVGLPALLLFLQPDTSGALMLMGTAAILVFMSGAPLRALAGAAVLGAVLLAGAAWLRPYVLDRLRVFLDPWSSSQAEGFQVVQSFVAFGRGGSFGVGLGDGRQKLFYLPEAHTDFVLSVVAEETGLIGVALVLGAFAALAVAGLQIARTAQTRFGLLLAAAMTAGLVLPAALNAAVVMGVAPATGLTLPFLSYGRTALLMSFLAIGVLLGIARNPLPEPRPALVGAAGRGADRPKPRRRSARGRIPGKRRPR